MYIDINDVSKCYRTNKEDFTALSNMNLSIDKGEFICLLGASGCGKTTLLNLIAGFEKPSTGSITIDGKHVDGPVAENITIFQQYGLFPWKNVEKNVEFGLLNKRLSSQQKKEIASKYIKMVGLENFSKAYPSQLSGGMQQRVAIARALAVNPQIIFMDEPFGALDALTRIKMQDEILQIQREQQKTVIFVTHDIEEAVFLADRIVIMTPNPARVKTILTVSLGKHRDRMSSDFLKIREKVFEIFEMKENVNIEYYI